MLMFWRRLVFLWPAVVLIFILRPAKAQEGPDIGGYWQFQYRFRLAGEDKEDLPYTNIYSRLWIKLHSDISDNVAAHASGDFRLYGITDATTLEDLKDPDMQFPLVGLPQIRGDYFLIPSLLESK